jgi:hypothetical protein
MDPIVLAVASIREALPLDLSEIALSYEPA